MAPNIEDPETDALARRLAALTGERISDAIRISLEERLRREELHRGGKGEPRAAESHIEEYNKLRVVDPREPDEILGYDENGLPT